LLRISQQSLCSKLKQDSPGDFLPNTFHGATSHIPYFPYPPYTHFPLVAATRSKLNVVKNIFTKTKASETHKSYFKNFELPGKSHPVNCAWQRW